MKKRPHVVIHCPSVSLSSKDLRDGHNHWETRQNVHIARVTDVIDENTDVIYICPHDNVNDVDAYWSRLLQIAGIENPGSRYRIVVPENAPILPGHMSLTAKLIFSPKALARIKYFVGDRPAYIVPGALGKEDVDLSVALGYPVLGPNPMRAMGIRMRTRRRKILRSSQVNVSPGVELRANFFLKVRKEEEQALAGGPGGARGGRAASPLHRLRELLHYAQVASCELSQGVPSVYDILKISDSIRRILQKEGMSVFAMALALARDAMGSLRDLLDEMRHCYPVMTPTEILAGELACLMAQHPGHPRWLFKLDDEHRGRGFAYLDLKGDKDLSRELLRVADTEHGRDLVAVLDVQARAEAVVAIAHVLEEALPQRCTVCSALYGKWGSYAEQLIRRGGVIEAVPAQVVGSPTVTATISPDGDVAVVATHEMVFCPAYQAIGSSFPQQSVPPGALSDAAEAVARSLYKSGIIGPVSLSFVALREKGLLRLWGVDFDLSWTPAGCAFKLFHLLADGDFSPRSGAYLAQEGATAPNEIVSAHQDVVGALPDEMEGGGSHLVRRCFVALDVVAHPVLRMTKVSAGRRGGAAAAPPHRAAGPVRRGARGAERIPSPAPGPPGPVAAPRSSPRPTDPDRPTPTDRPRPTAPDRAPSPPLPPPAVLRALRAAQGGGPVLRYGAQAGRDVQHHRQLHVRVHRVPRRRDHGARRLRGGQALPGRRPPPGR